jgi:hypothetical protein
VLEADVLLENSRPARCSACPAGLVRPARHSWCIARSRRSARTHARCQGGFDLTVQAAAGVMSVTGEPEGAPVKAGVPLADFASGLYAAYSIAALIARVRAGGPGGQIDVPMFAATLAVSALQTSEYFGTGRNPVKLGSAHPRNSPYQAYQAGDGWFAIAAGNNKLWRSVRVVGARTAGRSALHHAHPRAQHQRELKAALDLHFVQQRGTGCRPLPRWVCLAHPSTVMPKPWPIRRCSTSNWCGRSSCPAAITRTPSAARCAWTASRSGEPRARPGRMPGGLAPRTRTTMTDRLARPSSPR